MIVLDTHAWLWWTSAPERLSGRARRALEEAAEIGLATISCWETAMLAARGRISLDRPVSAWIAQALAQPRLAALPLTAELALAAGLLDDRFPGDPADRMIYATARANRAGLVTKDAAIRAYDPRLTIW